MLAFFYFYYLSTYFFIPYTPAPMIAITAIITLVYIVVSPVLTVIITGALSWSSSPSTWLFGVESMSVIGFP